MAKKIITVFGATGKQGGAVVQTFLNDENLKDEWAVRGVTRNVGTLSAQKLVKQGAEMVNGNLNDKDSLVSAMQGAAAVFAVTNYWERMDQQLEIDQGKRLADAAKETGVPHFIWSSLINVKGLTNNELAHVYHFDGKAKVEEYVRSLGIPATFFMPGYFMSNLVGGQFRQLLPDNFKLALPVPETAPFPLLDTRDTGKFIKAIVHKRDQLLGERVYGATNYMTPREMIDAFKEMFPEAGKKARFVSTPHEEFVDMLEGWGFPGYAAAEMLENMRLMDEGGYYGGKSLDGSHAILEDELTTWEEYMRTAREYADLE